MQQNKPRCRPYNFHEVLLKMDQTTKSKMIKILEEYIKENLGDLGYGNF